MPLPAAQRANQLPAPSPTNTAAADLYRKKKAEYLYSFHCEEPTPQPVPVASKLRHSAVPTPGFLSQSERNRQWQTKLAWSPIGDIVAAKPTSAWDPKPRSDSAVYQAKVRAQLSAQETELESLKAELENSHARHGREIVQIQQEHRSTLHSERAKLDARHRSSLETATAEVEAREEDARAKERTTAGSAIAELHNELRVAKNSARLEARGVILGGINEVRNFAPYFHFHSADHELLRSHTI